MRVICDAPGQTCNRLWTYVNTVARCVVEKKRMVIIFYDWTIEDFPNLLGCPFIYFPLWQKWYLERGNGWGKYKGLTWKVTHNKRWDKIFSFFGFKKGWYLMDKECHYLAEAKPELQRIFRPREEIMSKASDMIAAMRQEADIIIGVHIRHGDYETFLGGRYYFTLEQYHQMMLRVQQLYSSQRVAFFISSNAPFSTDVFEGCQCRRFGKEPSGDILDLYTLSLCDRIFGPWSTYSRWASFIGEVPLYCIKTAEDQVTEESFSVITDFYHFANGENTTEYWLDDANFQP